MKRWKTTGWLLVGAGMGLVIAFAARWYWGVVAFVLLVAAMGGAYLAAGSLRRHSR